MCLLQAAAVRRKEEEEARLARHRACLRRRLTAKKAASPRQAAVSPPRRTASSPRRNKSPPRPVARAPFWRVAERAVERSFSAPDAASEEYCDAAATPMRGTPLRTGWQTPRRGIRVLVSPPRQRTTREEWTSEEASASLRALVSPPLWRASFAGATRDTEAVTRHTPARARRMRSETLDRLSSPPRRAPTTAATTHAAMKSPPCPRRSISAETLRRLSSPQRRALNEQQECAQDVYTACRRLQSAPPTRQPSSRATDTAVVARSTQIGNILRRAAALLSQEDNSAAVDCLQVCVEWGGRGGGGRLSGRPYIVELS